MKRATHQPETMQLTIYAGIYSKIYRVPDAGTVLPQHSHTHDHQTVLVAGGIEEWRDDRWMGLHWAPAIIEIPANHKHTFRTLTDNVVLICVHNADHLDDEGEPLVAAENNLVTED